MKKYITNLYGQAISSTAMTAQQMVASVAKSQGYEEIAIRAYNTGLDTDDQRRARIEGILASVSKDDMVIVQLPTWNGIAFDEVFLKILKERVENIVIFIQDFVPIMFTNNAYLFKRYIEAYNLATLAILPSRKMENKLRNEGFECPVIIQEIWDHITDLDFFNYPQFQKKLSFAGNISRFPFAGNWESDLILEVFSNGEIDKKGNVEIKGWKYDDELLRALNKGGFGLVWSENIENQREREYSEMNVSFKFSTYLAAGLPLIINKGLAKQSFVEKYHIGCAFETLEEAVNYIDNMSESSYDLMQKNVRIISKLVREGFFTKKLLIKIQEYLYL